MQPRFFVPPEDIQRSEGRLSVVLTGDNAHHAWRVLRLQTGDFVWISDGDGLDYAGRIVRIDSDGVRVELDEPITSSGEPSTHITLFQGLPKSDKMDWIVQKAAEVGIRTVVPVRAERSVVHLSDAKAVGRTERWRRIAMAAASQAGRGRVPVIQQPMSLRAAIEAWRLEAPDGLLLVPWEEERSRGIRSILRHLSEPLPSHVGIVIGPEGGLTSEELELAAGFGGLSCTLGPRILRTETAGTVVAAVVLYEFGEMGG